jgi:hypothetical protein
MVNDTDMIVACYPKLGRYLTVAAIRGKMPMKE